MKSVYRLTLLAGLAIIVSGMMPTAWAENVGDYGGDDYYGYGDEGGSGDYYGYGDEGGSGDYYGYGDEGGSGDLYVEEYNYGDNPTPPPPEHSDLYITLTGDGYTVSEEVNSAEGYSVTFLVNAVKNSAAEAAIPCIDENESETTTTFPAELEISIDGYETWNYNPTTDDWELDGLTYYKSVVTTAEEGESKYNKYQSFSGDLDGEQKQDDTLSVDWTITKETSTGEEQCDSYTYFVWHSYADNTWKKSGYQDITYSSDKPGAAYIGHPFTNHLTMTIHRSYDMDILVYNSKREEREEYNEDDDSGAITRSVETRDEYDNSRDGKNMDFQYEITLTTWSSRIKYPIDPIGTGRNNGLISIVDWIKIKERTEIYMRSPMSSDQGTGSARDLYGGTETTWYDDESELTGFEKEDQLWYSDSNITIDDDPSTDDESTRIIKQDYSRTTTFELFKQNDSNNNFIEHNLYHAASVKLKMLVLGNEENIQAKWSPFDLAKDKWSIDWGRDGIFFSDNPLPYDQEVAPYRKVEEEITFLFSRYFGKPWKIPSGSGK